MTSSIQATVQEWKPRFVQAGVWIGSGTEEAFLTRRRATDSDPLPHVHPLELLLNSRKLSKSRYIDSTSTYTPKHISVPAHGSSVVTCLLVSPDRGGGDGGRVITASDDHTIRIYDLSSGRLVQILEGHEGGVWALCLKANQLISGSTDCTIRIWNLPEITAADPDHPQKIKCTHIFTGHTSTVRSMSIVRPELYTRTVSEKGQAVKEKWPKRTLVISGSRDSRVGVWCLPRSSDNTTTGEEHWQTSADNPYHVQFLEGHEQAVRGLDAKGRIAVSGSYDTTVRIWDIEHGRCTHVLRGHTQKVYTVILDILRNQTISGSMDGTAKIWSLETGACLHTLSGHTSLIGLIAVSPSYIISASADAQLRIWDPVSGECKQTLTGHPGAITCFAQDEWKVVSGSDSALKIWDPRTGHHVRDLLSGTGIGGVWQVAFDGRWCVAASSRQEEEEDNARVRYPTVLDIFDFGEDEDGWVGERFDGAVVSEDEDEDGDV